METINGWITPTVEAYESKQTELGLAYHINSPRYAGRVTDGVVIPDVDLVAGGYFMRDIKGLGPDNITMADINQGPEPE
jgi:hypothetical protein|tara:strand:- start:65 stop:301 length:237 start_codon:yes stop_codon:yes gene_type:complete